MLIRTIAIVVSLVLAGCMKTVDTACDAFTTISYSAKSDTPETVTQVRQHNAAYSAICK